MTQTGAPSSNPGSLSAATRLAWLLLILATLYLSYFRNLGTIGLVGPDEPRYAWIARDMAESGDWITPRLYGKSWFEKPVLYYWGAAASFKLFGASESAARLPSAIAALLATLSMAWLAWRVYGAEVARWLLLLLPSTVGMIGFSHAAATDMAFAGMLTAAMVFTAVVLGLVPRKADPAAGHSLLPAMVGLGFFLGLAVLAKGPAAIILAGGAVLFWALFTRRWRDAFRCLHPLGIAVFCLTALPWYIVCAWRNPDFFRVFFVEHNFRRYLTPEFQHVQPFWFYLPILVVAFLPWAMLLLWAVYSGIQAAVRRRIVASPTIFLVTWALFCVAFFTVSKSKLPGYILPAIPAFGLLLAKEFVAVEERLANALRWSLVGFALLLVLAAVPLTTINRLSASSPGDRRFLVIVPLLFALANYLLSLKPGRNRSVSAFAPVPILALLLLFPKLVAIALPFDPSGRSIARELQEERIPVDQVFVAKMPRGQHFSLNFYARREVPEWNPEEPRKGYLLLRNRRCAELVRAPWTCAQDPSYLASSGYFVFRVEPEDLVGSFGGGDFHVPGGTGAGDSRDRQPR